MCKHLDALLEILGEDGVALGSDFDGIQISTIFQIAQVCQNLLLQ